MGVVDWLFVALYLVLLVIIGVQTTRRVQNPEDFAVAGNRFTFSGLVVGLVTNLVILLVVYNLVDKREASSTTAGEVASREEV